jgi:hypothetical protein
MLGGIIFKIFLFVALIIPLGDAKELQKARENDALR